VVALIHGQSDYCPVDPIESEALPTNVLSCGARVKLKGPAVSEQAGPPPGVIGGDLNRLCIAPSIVGLKA